jgi:hypothetical protein
VLFSFCELTRFPQFLITVDRKFVFLVMSRRLWQCQRWQFKMAPNLNLYSRDIFKTQFVSLRYSFSDSELNRLNMGYRNNRWFNEGTSSLLSSLALTLNICGYLLFFFKNPNSKTRATLKLSVMCLNIFFNFRLRD